ncbi:MAG: Lrp/AsnC family transcriptional regulator [Kordiimonas sp.]
MKNSSEYKDLDKFDVRILKALQRDGRITKLQLADEIGLSSTPCWERMNKLEKAGVIQGYHAELDYRKLVGVSYFRVFVVIRNYSLSISRLFEDMIASMPEVVECEAVLGESDYVLKVLAKSVDEYLQIMEEMQSLDKVDMDYQTLPVSKVLKSEPDVDVEELYNRFVPT